jgi:hypothetical protein
MGRALRMSSSASWISVARPLSSYKSLPCRGTCGFGGCGSAPGGIPASGSGSAPINALGGWARSISRCLFRCLFLRSRSVTPGNIATPHRESCQRHYTIGDPSLVAWDGMRNTRFPGHGLALAGRFSIFLSIPRSLVKNRVGDRWCRYRGSPIGSSTTSLSLTLLS